MSQPSPQMNESDRSHVPLSVRMRPRTLAEFIGQEHVLSKGKLLQRVIQADRLASLILYGPPGVGKTSLAWCIASSSGARFVAINATMSNVEELRKIIAAAETHKQKTSGRTICFIDEIHRFNKAQQDVLLPHVESAAIILIGATVHNPSFALVSALLSRSLVCELKSLQPENVNTIILRALSDRDRGLGSMRVMLDDDARSFLIRMCEGDARRALNALEIAALTTPPQADSTVRVTLDIAAESIQKKAIVYDRDGDGHYDTASAFIKSIRGSDPDAALYWMAKMLYAGEDERFIARRLCISAAEDVGAADPMALVIASAALQVAEFVGMPEARIPLAEAVVYLACAPKSNAAYIALEKAREAIEKESVQEVPEHLKDASYQGAKNLGHGAGYKHAHDYKDHYVVQDYLRKSARFYEPTDIGFESKIKKRLEELRRGK
jgi:putative ATPase